MGDRRRQHVETFGRGKSFTETTYCSTFYGIVSIFGQRSTVGNHLYVTDRLEDGTLRHVGSHLGCFTAGNWLLGMFWGSTLFGTELTSRIDCQVVD